MIECINCGDADCCERTDLKNEPVLCNECYLSALEFDEERQRNIGLDMVKKMIAAYTRNKHNA